MRCPSHPNKMEFRNKPNVERYGFALRHPNKVKTAAVFQPGSSFSTVMNVKIEKRLTVVRSRSEAAILSHGDTVDALVPEERDQLFFAMESMARKCRLGNLTFSEHRGSLRSLKRFHTHIIVEDEDDFKMFIPPHNHKFLVRNDNQTRTTELKTWATKDYTECEQRVFRLALSDTETPALPDDVEFEIDKGCSRIHLPIVSGENPLDTVYRYVHQFGLKNFHYGLVFAPGGMLTDIFLHLFPPDFIDHLVMQRGKPLTFVQEYLQNFRNGIEQEDWGTFLTT